MGSRPDLTPAENAARLAMIGMLPGEIQRMDAELEAMALFWAPLAKAQATELAGALIDAPVHAPLREDAVCESLPLHAVLQNAKLVEGEYIRVPKAYDAPEDKP